MHRIWQAFVLEPHRHPQFKLSTAPFFVEKMRDIVGVCLHPLEDAVILCVDEKSQIQTLERVQPMLPMGLTMRTAYARLPPPWNGHALAALDAAKGTVINPAAPSPPGVSGLLATRRFEQATNPATRTGARHESPCTRETCNQLATSGH